MSSIDSTFTSDKMLLKDLLKDIQDCKIQLPDFQRGWVWDDEHIRDLIESLSLSYPIGTIMLLETGGQSVRFKPRTIDGAQPNNRYPDQLILDGQQRLTSLFQALYSGSVVQTRDARKKPICRWYYLDMNKALKKNGDRSDAIISLPEDRQIKNFRGGVVYDYSKQEFEFRDCLFPLNRLFDSSGWRYDFNVYWNHDRDKSILFDAFEREIIDRFRSYWIPIIYVKKETPKVAVCQVFEKVNTGGVSLTVFELLTATFAAEDFSLRDDWNDRISRFKDYRVLRNMQSTDFLQGIALLVTYQKQLDAKKDGRSGDDLPGVGCKRKDILNLSKDEYLAWADKLEKGFKAAARFLRRQHIFDRRDLPYGTQAVPIASVFAWLEEKMEPDGVQRKLAQWYWCGVLGELYGSAVESRFARDLPDLVNWLVTPDQLPKTIQDANFVPSRLHTLKTRNSAAYKGIHALLMRKGCEDFRTGIKIEEQAYFDDRVDIHHIFPYDWCTQNGIDARSRDCVVNKAPLAARTNRMIGGSAPSQYLDKLQNDANISEERMDQILNSHAIEPMKMRANDFQGFFEARESELLDMIEKATGKQVIRERVNAELEMDEDYEGDSQIEETP